MFIKISNLNDGEYEFQFENFVEKLQLEKPFTGKFNTNVVLNKLKDQIIIDVITDFNINYDCDRCGIEIDKEYTSEYKMVYLMDEKPEETDSLNVSYLSRDAVKIDITNDVREFALLSLPMKKLCREDCKGLCPKCGANLNTEECHCKNDDTDPRWKPLENLKDKLNLN